MMQEQERKYAESLRRRYGEKSASENKMEKLRKLDAAVRRPAEIFGAGRGYVLGDGSVCRPYAARYRDRHRGDRHCFRQLFSLPRDPQFAQEKARQRDPLPFRRIAQRLKR